MLIEGPSKTDKSVYSGRTDSGKLVHVTGEGVETGRFLRVHIDKAETFALFGSVVSDEK